MSTERIRSSNPGNPGANSSVVLYDDTPGTSANSVNKSRVEIVLFADQIVTIKHEWSDTPSGTLRQISSTATSANTLYEARPRLRAGNNKITAITTTAPTVFQCAVCTNSSPVSDA